SSDLAPFGADVVPEVYNNCAKSVSSAVSQPSCVKMSASAWSSSSTVCTVSRICELATTCSKVLAEEMLSTVSTYSSSTMMTDASLSDTRYCSSGPVRAKLMGTCTSPARDAAKNRI